MRTVPSISSNLSDSEAQPEQHLANGDKHSKALAGVLAKPNIAGQFLLLAIIILGAGLRFYDLGGKSLWTDEINRITMPTRDLIYELVAVLFIRFVTYFGRSEFLIRLPFAIVGILGIPAVYSTAKLLLGKRVGLVSALLFSISPFNIRYSQDASPYTAMMFLSLLSLFLLLKALRRGGWRWWIAFVFVSVLNLYNHAFAIFVVASEMAFAAYTVRFPPKEASRLDSMKRLEGPYWTRLPSVLLILIGAGSITVAVAADLLGIGSQTGVGVKQIALLLAGLALLLSSMVIRKITHVSVLRISIVGVVLLMALLPLLYVLIGPGEAAGIKSQGDVRTFTGLSFYADTFGGLGAGTGLALYIYWGTCLVGMLACVKGRADLVLLSVLWITLPFVALKIPFARVFHMRFVSFIIPIYLIVIAKGITSISEFASQLAGRVFRDTIPGWGISLILTVGVFGWLSVEPVRAYYQAQKEDWRGVSAFLSEQTESGDLIFQLVLSPRDGIPYYLGRRLVNGEVRFVHVEDGREIDQDDLPADVWWVLRTEGPEEPLQPGRVSTLKALLGPGFNVHPFAHVAVIHRKEPIANVEELLRVASELLLVEAQFDRERQQPKYAWAWLGLGDASLATGNLTRAAGFYSRAIEVNPGVVDGYMLLAHVHRKRGQLDEALRRCEQAVEVNPAYGPARMQLWWVLREQGNEEEAVAGFEQALRDLGPEWIELSALQWSDLLMRPSEVEAAIHVLQEAQETVPYSGRLHLHLAKAYLEEARSSTERQHMFLDLAQTELDKAESLLPGDAELHATGVTLAEVQGLVE